MRTTTAWIGFATLLGLASCGEDARMTTEAVPAETAPVETTPIETTTVEVLPIQGAAIDGSDDVQPTPAEDVAPDSPSEAGADAIPGDTADDLPRLDEELSGDALAEAKAEVLAKMKALPEPEPAAELDDEIDVNAKGPFTIAYRDLTLIDYDVDAMLDYMLFPEEYEGEEVKDLQFPPAIKRLDGKVVTIVGYMIPGEMDQGNVRDFMLVRDLLGCCFGGTPMPDEWLDVVMEEDAEAVYRPYMPTRVTGVLTLGGDQDEAGFALGVYKLKGTKVTVED